jgi:cyclase
MSDLPASDHFDIREIAPGVHALIAGRRGTAVSNSAVVDLGDRTLVFDAFQTLQAADDLLAVTRALTGRSAAVVVNSHWHPDHITGNQVFAGADIVATASTVELIAANNPSDLESLAREIEEMIDFARRALETAADEESRARAEGWLRVRGALRDGLPRFRLTLPNKTIEDRLIVAGEGRTVEILTYGGGHTASDLFVHLPGEGIVVAGDLLFAGLHPRVDDGDAGAWAAILDRMSLLASPTWVPGHGRLADAGDAAALAAYLRAVEATVAAVVAGGLDADAVAALPVPPGSEDWEGRFRFAGSVRALAARARDEEGDR